MSLQIYLILYEEWIVIQIVYIFSMILFNLRFCKLQDKRLGFPSFVM